MRCVSFPRPVGSASASEANIADRSLGVTSGGRLGARLEEVGQPATVLGPFFMRFQRDGMALTSAGDVADFTATARQALLTETEQAMSDDAIAHVLDGFASLPAFPDAAPALRKLSDAGVSVGCLTIGDPRNTRSFLTGAGLETYVDRVVTCDEVGVWKPAPRAYRHTAKALDCELDRMALVAVHAWDCHGAKRVGALAGWCSRLEGEPGDVFMPADVHGDDLVEVVEDLLALCRRCHRAAGARARNFLTWRRRKGAESGCPGCHGERGGSGPLSVEVQQAHADDWTVGHGHLGFGAVARRASGRSWTAGLRRHCAGEAAAGAAHDPEWQTRVAA
jgi:2-haloacid dehalogenase